MPLNPRQILKTYFGYDNFRPQQEEIIQNALFGSDGLVLMPTGGGKSLCYQVPALCMEGTTIVVSPLISLMKDQVDALQANGIAAYAINSVQGESENARIRQACINGDIKLLYMAPETLLREIPALLHDINISLFAIDEAHCVSQWGHDFRPEYTQLHVLRTEFPSVPVMALTATADKVTRQDILSQLALKEPAIFISSFDRPNLNLEVKRGLKGKDKMRTLLEFIKKHPHQSGIVYCLARKTTDSLSEQLRGFGFSARPYHAGLSAEEREETQQAFIRDQVEIVVATIAFGMGIDKSNVRFVVHYNLPKSIESFYQEIGRAGRDGLPSDTLLFYNYADIIQLTQFARASGQRDINMERLDRMKEYAEAQVCRRRILLNYFGEETDHDCMHCDVCLNPPQRFDGTVLVQKALSAIVRANQKIGFQTVVDILRGAFSPTVREGGFDKLKTFGVGRDIPSRDWQDYLLQMLQSGLFEIAYDDNNHLRITPLGTEVLYGRNQLQLAVPVREEPKPKSAKRKTADKSETRLPLGAPIQQSAAASEKLFQHLREVRRELAEKQGYPPYIVMSDVTLHLIAQICPKTIEEFGSISGIGEFKKKKYGKTFVDAILAFTR